MKTYAELLPHITSSDYETHFWNTLRGKTTHREELPSNLDLPASDLALSPADQDKYMAALKKENKE